MTPQLVSATNFCKSLGSKPHLRYAIEGGSYQASVIVRINRLGGINGQDCQYVLDNAEICKGTVNFEQTGEICVTFSQNSQV